MGYSGARGTLIYEKNLKAKISCPFKDIVKPGNRGAEHGTKRTSRLRKQSPMCLGQL